MSITLQFKENRVVYILLSYVIIYNHIVPKTTQLYAVDLVLIWDTHYSLQFHADLDVYDYQLWDIIT